MEPFAGRASFLASGSTSRRFTARKGNAMSSTDYGKSSGQSGRASDLSRNGLPGDGKKAGATSNDWAQDISKLQEQVTQLSETMQKYAQDATKNAASTMQSVAGQVGDAASNAYESGAQIASSATETAKTFASELERTARRNPLGALAGALAAGVLIGLITRNRS
jgi:ElaB/YqjD/DUF883 family membrane-anchored ribosome-binding protein